MKRLSFGLLFALTIFFCAGAIRAQVTSIRTECYPVDAHGNVIPGQRFVVAAASDTLESFPSYILVWRQPVDSPVPATNSLRLPLEAQVELLNDVAHKVYFYHYTLHYAMGRREVLIEYTYGKRDKQGQSADSTTIRIKRSGIPGLDTGGVISEGYHCQ